MHILYDILIQPLVVIYDLIFALIYGIVESPVPAIIGLSIVVNLAVLPLYEKADKIQQEEQIKSKKMRKWVKHIRKTFKGEVRFMMLSNYYRLENYNPAGVLKEAVPLLLQVPFFLAAYNYISSLDYFDGVSFGSINNLFAPDGLLTIHGISINILPILMTLINVIAGFVYLKDGTVSQKIQSYGLAVLFLVLLYNSPSLLVIYWLMNNIFSLGKNIYYKYNKLSKTMISNICSVLVLIFGIVSLLFLPVDTSIDDLLVISMIVISYLVIMKNIISYYVSTHPESGEQIKKITGVIKADSIDRKSLLKSIFIAEICITLLLGLYIPSTVLSSSATEFMDMSNGKFNYSLLGYPFLIYFGLIILWLTILVLSRDKQYIRKSVSVIWLVLGVALVNQFVFDPRIGVLYTNLSFEKVISKTPLKNGLDIGLSILVGLLFVFIFNKKSKLMGRIGIILSLAFVIMSSLNIFKIVKTVKEAGFTTVEDDQPLKLSKHGKNVIVFMLDRAIGEYVPYIFDEKPEYKDYFEGFVHYKNTVSFGVKTDFGAPALFGGYEYSPTELNKREDKTVVEKHNEALTIMPILFSKQGYNVTVCDPPLAGYENIPDLSIYDDYPEITAYNLIGKYAANMEIEYTGDSSLVQKHNFIVYSLFRTVPLFMKEAVYDNGNYLATVSGKHHYSQTFIDDYSELDVLPEITEIVDDDSNNFLMMQNCTPHDPEPLKSPDYLPDGSKVDYDTLPSELVLGDKRMSVGLPWHWDHYSTNVATYREIGQWMEYLKEQGVYDNTRIILVADHGHRLDQFDYFDHPDGLDIERVNPLLMVKDFNSKESFSESMDFMTNADTPTLAMEGIIDNPENPFTGNAINDDLKKKGPLHIFVSQLWGTSDGSKPQFDMSHSTWWTVHDNIYDMDNWEKGESQ